MNYLFTNCIFQFLGEKKEDKEDPEKIDEFNFKKKNVHTFFQIQKLKWVNKIIDTFFCLRKKYDYKNDHDILPHPP